MTLQLLPEVPTLDALLLPPLVGIRALFPSLSLPFYPEWGRVPVVPPCLSRGGDRGWLALVAQSYADISEIAAVCDFWDLLTDGDHRGGHARKFPLCPRAVARGEGWSMPIRSIEPGEVFGLVRVVGYCTTGRAPWWYLDTADKAPVRSGIVAPPPLGYDSVTPFTIGGATVEKLREEWRREWKTNRQLKASTGATL